MRRLRGLIINAYGVIGGRVKGMIVGGPAWMASQAFDVQVKVDAATTERWNKLPQQPVDEERRALLRELLAERFQLKLHCELREMPVFVLTVAKNGSKLRPAGRRNESFRRDIKEPNRLLWPRPFQGHWHMQLLDLVMLNALAGRRARTRCKDASRGFPKERTCSEGESRTRTAFRARRRRQMRDPKEIEELEAEIARDKKRYSEIGRIEGEILENISHQGFAAASQEARLRDEKQALAETIRRNEEMLARARSQIN